MADRASQKADFCIEIDFQKGTENPSRIFKTMTELIEAFQLLDIDLVKSIHPEIAPVAIIEDIEAGSLRTWLAYVLKSADDDALKNLDWKKAVGSYLVKAKYVVLNFIEKKTTITTREEIGTIEKELLDLAKQTDVIHIPAYQPIPPKKMLEDLNTVTSALSHLAEQDKAIYFGAQSDDKTTINAEFYIAPEAIENLLTREVLTSKTEMILKVKKPDYLGQSQWEFRHGRRAITAKITDVEWVRKFQSRQEDVRPGDSLRVEMATQVKYGYDNEVIGTSYNISHVIEVLPGSTEDQLSLLFNEESED